MRKNYKLALIVLLVSCSLSNAMEKDTVGDNNLEYQKCTDDKLRIDGKLAKLRRLGCKVFIENGIIDGRDVQGLLDAFAKYGIVDQAFLHQLASCENVSMNENNRNRFLLLVAPRKENILDNLLSSTLESQKSLLKELSEKSNIIIKRKPKQH